MKKVVVVVQGFPASTIGNLSDNGIERKEYTNVIAFNNERGELVIAKLAEYYCHSKNDVKPKSEQLRGETIAVFKEWLYWEDVSEK